MSHVDTPPRIRPFSLELSARAKAIEAIDDSFRRTVGSKLGLQKTWIRARFLLNALYLEFASMDMWFAHLDIWLLDQSTRYSVIVNWCHILQYSIVQYSTT
jgi:hypothetical protein